MNPLYLGLDLGGTHIKAGILNPHAKSKTRLLSRITVPTDAAGSLSPSHVVAALAEAARLATKAANIQHKNVCAAGIVAPGLLHLGKGAVLRAANFPTWRNVPLRAQLSKILNLPTVLENDANAATYGEWWSQNLRRGGTKQPSHANSQADHIFLLITLGTGIGAGIIHNGCLLRGSSNLAGEIGHAILVPNGDPCPCGQRGCLERYCSAQNFAHRTARQLIASPKLRRTSSLTKILAAQKILTSEQIAQHAQAGDLFAKQAWDQLCQYLAIALVNICRTLDPAHIALGGGLANAGDFLLKNVQRHLTQQWWSLNKPRVKLTLAQLGNDAGLIGAAAIAHDTHAPLSAPHP